MNFLQVGLNIYGKIIIKIIESSIIHMVIHWFENMRIPNY